MFSYINRKFQNGYYRELEKNPKLVELVNCRAMYLQKFVDILPTYLWIKCGGWVEKILTIKVKATCLSF